MFTSQNITRLLEKKYREDVHVYNDAIIITEFHHNNNAYVIYTLYNI